MWPIFDVTVQGFPSVAYTAPTRGKAMSRALRDYQNYDDRATFKTFMQIARAHVRKEPLPTDGYDYIRRSYGVDVKIGQRVRLINEGASSGKEGTVVYPNRPSTAHVHVAFNDKGDASWVHPMSIEILP